MVYKSNTRIHVLEKYKQHGLTYTLELCKKAIRSRTFKDENQFRDELHGELGEVSLECILMEFCKKHKDCFYFKGLIIKDDSRLAKSMTTEIDMVLCTPWMLYLFECKSYNFDKKLIGSCTLMSEQIKTDDNVLFKLHLSKQLELHLSMLKNRTDAFIKSNTKYHPYKSIFYDFTIKQTEDCRNRYFSKLIPHLNETNVIPYLETDIRRKEVWSMELLKSSLQTISDDSAKLEEEHIASVRARHNSNQSV